MAVNARPAIPSPVVHPRLGRTERRGDMASSGCTRMARQGLGREPWEGPLDYADRLARARPGQADALRTICASYASLRYGRDVDKDALNALRHRIDALRNP